MANTNTGSFEDDICQLSTEETSLGRSEVSQATRPAPGSVVAELMSVDDMLNYVTALERKDASMTNRITASKVRLSELENTSYNGRYVWPLCDFPKARRAAASMGHGSQNSPSFYTGRQGYRMQLKASPNGRDDGEGIDLALELVILPNQWDSILAWPFKAVVKLGLIRPVTLEKVTKTYHICAPRPLDGPITLCCCNNLEDLEKIQTDYVDDRNIFLDVEVRQFEN